MQCIKQWQMLSLEWQRQVCRMVQGFSPVSHVDTTCDTENRSKACHMGSTICSMRVWCGTNRPGCQAHLLQLRLRVQVAVPALLAGAARHVQRDCCPATRAQLLHQLLQPSLLLRSPQLRLASLADPYPCQRLCLRERRHTGGGLGCSCSGCRICCCSGCGAADAEAACVACHGHEC